MFLRHKDLSNLEGTIYGELDAELSLRDALTWNTASYAQACLAIVACQSVRLVKLLLFQAELRLVDVETRDPR